MANTKFNFKTFLAEYPDAKHVTLKLFPGATISADLIDECYSKSLGKMILSVHKKTVIHAYFSDLAFTKKQKEV